MVSFCDRVFVCDVEHESCLPPCSDNILTTNVTNGDATSSNRKKRSWKRRKEQKETFLQNLFPRKRNNNLMVTYSYKITVKS